MTTYKIEYAQTSSAYQGVYCTPMLANRKHL